MSSVLDRRFLCVLAVCKCRGFYLLNPNSDIPRSPTDSCAGCLHPWVTHLTPALPADHPNAFFNRGGTEAFTCGGYYSPQSPTAATGVPPCICGVSFAEHYGRLEFEAALRAQAPSPSQPLNVNATQATASTSTMPPIPTPSVPSSYMPAAVTPAPTYASLRTPSGLVFAPPPPVVPGFTTSPSQLPSSLLSNRPDPITVFTPSIPPTTVGQLRNDSLSRMHATNAISSAGGTGNRNTLRTTIDVGILPFNGVDRVSGFPASFAVMNDNRPGLFRVLQKHGLIVEASWKVGSSPRVIFIKLATAVKRAVEDGGYRLPGAVFDTSEYEGQGWHILQQKHRANKYKLHKRTGLTTATLTEKTILSLTKHHPLEATGRQGFLMIAPKEGLMRAPLEHRIPVEATPSATARNQPHACFAKHMLRGLSLADTFYIDQHDTGCIITLCPADNPPSTSSASAATPATAAVISNFDAQEDRGRIRSYSNAFGSQSVALQIHNRPRLDAAVALTHPALPSESAFPIPMDTDTPTGAMQAAPPPMEVIPPVIITTPPTNSTQRRIVPRPSSHKSWTLYIYRWQQLTHAAVPSLEGQEAPAVPINRIEVTGHNHMAIARHLVSALRQRRHEELEPGCYGEFDIPDFVWESNANIGDLSTLVPSKPMVTNFTICPSPTSEFKHRAIGSGPQLAVFRGANIAIFENLQYWSAGQYGNQGFLPNYTGQDDDLMSPRTRAVFETAGYILALTMLQVRQVVLVNTWLLTALLAGPTNIFVDLRTIRQLDPALADEVAPWFEFDYLGGETDVSPELNGVFAEVWNSTANMMFERPGKRSEATHKRFTTSIFLHYALGSKNATKQAEFKAMQRGFDVTLAPGIKLCKLSQQHHFDGSSIQDIVNIAKVEPRQMVYAMMNRKVTGVGEVVSLIDFVPQNTVGLFNEDEGLLADVLVEIVKGRIIQYLRGSGHPPGCVGTTTASVEESSTSQDDKLFRSRLFLESLTGSDLLPLSDDKPLKVYVNVLSPLDFSGCTDEEQEAKINDEEVDNSPKIRVCFNSLTFSTTRHFLDLACSYITDEGASSLATFDNFVHTCLWDRDTFNML